MSNYFIYIGSSANKNFRLGMSKSLWGSKHYNRISQIEAGDHIYFVTSCVWDKSIFGKEVPPGYPRVDEGLFKGFSSKIYHCEATSGVNESPNKNGDIWSGNYYFQFSFKKISEYSDIIISPGFLNPVISEKIKKSILSKSAEKIDMPIDFSPREINYNDNPEQYETDSEGELEGKRYLSKHMKLERNKTLKNKKIKDFIKKNGKLSCEICNIDYREVYNLKFSPEKGFDVHHIRPLSESGETITKTSDLIIVCPNCHRTLHSQVPCLHPEKII